MKGVERMKTKILVLVAILFLSGCNSKSVSQLNEEDYEGYQAIIVQFYNGSSSGTVSCPVDEWKYITEGMIYIKCAERLSGTGHIVGEHLVHESNIRFQKYTQIEE